MRYALVYSALVASASAHGLITSIEGANGVSMPGLSVADGTPRDCSTNGCGSQADTSIIRDRDISSGKASPLGRTEGSGPVNPSTMIKAFMTPSNAARDVGQEDILAQRREEHKRGISELFSSKAKSAGKKSNYAQETMVASMAGQGASKGLPTSSDNGEVSMVFRQINQDGAGPLTATVDATSGGSDAKAFRKAKVTQDVPGLGIGGLSLATNTEFPVKVQMPQGMTCEGKVAGAENVCIVRVRNSALAGPFGGSAAFTQSPAARKRAIAYRLRKRFEINRPSEAEELAAADAAEQEDDEE